MRLLGYLLAIPVYIALWAAITLLNPWHLSVGTVGVVVGMVIYFPLAEALSRYLRYRKTSQDESPIVDYGKKTAIVSSKGKTVLPESKISDSVNRIDRADEMDRDSSALTDEHYKLAGEEIDGHFVVNKDELKEVTQAPETFDNVLVFKQSGMSGIESRYYLILSKNEGILFSQDAGKAQRILKTDVGTGSVGGSFGPKEKIELMSIFHNLFLVAWASDDLKDLQAKVKLWPLVKSGADPLLLIYLGMMIENKNPNLWLSWKLPYLNVDEFASFLLRSRKDQDQFIELFQKKGIDISCIGTVISNLAKLNSKNSRTLSDIIISSKKALILKSLSKWHKLLVANAIIVVLSIGYSIIMSFIDSWERPDVLLLAIIGIFFVFPLIGLVITTEKMRGILRSFSDSNSLPRP